MVNKIYFVRHGSRIDNEDPTWEEDAERPHDPPLTGEGFQQAAAAGMALKGKSIGHLFSSPFYRTLQTADVIAEILDLPVRVEPGFSEWMNKEWYSSKPQILSKEEREEEFSRIDTHYNPLLYPEFPELKENRDMFNRIRKVLEKVIATCEDAILVVGHGATLGQMARVLTGTAGNINLDVCAINLFVMESGDWQLALASSDHLETK